MIDFNSFCYIACAKVVHYKIESKVTVFSRIERFIAYRYIKLKYAEKRRNPANSGGNNNNNTLLGHSSAFIIVVYCWMKIINMSKTHKVIFLR